VTYRPETSARPFTSSDVERIAQDVVAEVERVVRRQTGDDRARPDRVLAGGTSLGGRARTCQDLIVRSLARVLGLETSRIQFTPDLMPADVTGSGVFDQRRGELTFRPGPVFANLVLGDEINRAPPKTQSALLEAMQEGQVTVDGNTHLPPLRCGRGHPEPDRVRRHLSAPEAQLDRFLLRIPVGYPDRDAEWDVIRRRAERGQEQLDLLRSRTPARSCPCARRWSASS